MKSLGAVAVVLAALAVTGCSDDDGRHDEDAGEMENPFYPHEALLGDAATVLVADVESIEAANAGTEAVTLRPLAMFKGGVDVSAAGTYTLSRPVGERDRTGRGFWLLDGDGLPLASPDPDRPAQSYPWSKSEWAHVVFAALPDAVPVAEVLGSAPIVFEGTAAGRGGARVVDGVVTVRVARVLRGEVGAGSGGEVEIEAAGATVRPVSGTVVWLVETVRRRRSAAHRHVGPGPVDVELPGAG